MSFVRTTLEPTLPAPRRTQRRSARTLFGDFASGRSTLLIGAVLLAAVPKLLSWAVIHGVWAGDGAACSTAACACWSFLRAKFRFILFGIYPPGEQWRPALVVAIIVGLDTVDVCHVSLDAQTLIALGRRHRRPCD